MKKLVPVVLQIQAATYVPRATALQLPRNISQITTYAFESWKMPKEAYSHAPQRTPKESKKSYNHEPKATRDASGL
jgi:hypothetical protein